MVTKSYGHKVTWSQSHMVSKSHGLKIQNNGSGIKRVISLMQYANAPLPKFEVFGNTFKVTLFPISEIENGGVNGGVNQLLEIIRQTPGINTSRLCELIKISQRTLERNLKELKDKNKIEFLGSPRAGGYHVIPAGKQISSGGVNGGVNGGESGGVNELLTIIRQNPGVNVSQLAEIFLISKRTLERGIKKLKSEDKIEFRGAPKTGGYFVK